MSSEPKVEGKDGIGFVMPHGGFFVYLFLFFIYYIVAQYSYIRIIYGLYPSFSSCLFHSFNFFTN